MPEAYRHLDGELEGIGRGLLDVAAGRVVPHDKAMARLEETIKAARRSKR